MTTHWQMGSVLVLHITCYICFHPLLLERDWGTTAFYPLPRFFLKMRLKDGEKQIVFPV